MSARLFRLKAAYEAAGHPGLHAVADHLQALGFDASCLDDLLYEIVDEVVQQLERELGASTAHSLAAQEFSAADEIGAHSMVDQLKVIAQWRGGPSVLLQVLSSHLRLALSDTLVSPVFHSTAATHQLASGEA